jgi:hypothetical protein
MSLMRTTTIPARPASQWPVAMRLRFKPDADIEPRYRALRGTPVIVTSELRLIGPSGDEGRWSWRQEVLAMGGGFRLGWARPDQLELPVDELDG